MRVQVNRNTRRSGRIVLLLLLAAIGVAAGQPAVAIETYQLDSAHSAVGFKIRHFFSQVAGRFTDFSATLQYDPEQPTDSQIELIIQTASIDTDNQRRDTHLRSDDFFSVQTFPTITFRSKKITATEKPNHYAVVGDLTIRDVTREETIAVEMLGLAEISGMGKRGGFRATATIDRTQYGVTWNRVFEAGGAMLGDDVQVEVSLEVVRQ